MTGDAGSAPARGGAGLATLAAARAALLGGAIAGLVDGLVTAFTGSRSAGPRAWLLVPAAMGVTALGAALGGAALVGLRAAIERLRPRWAGARAAAAAALPLFGPLVVYDALSLFGGSWISRLPGRRPLSWVLAALGLAALAWLAAALAARLAAGRDGRRWAAALALAAVGMFAADRLVLPRLYPWFHLTLRVGLVVALVLAVRFLRPDDRPRRLGTALLLAGAMLVAAGGGLAAVQRSHTLLFLAHQRSQLLASALSVVPLPARRRPPPAGRSVAVAGPPLPEGPRRPNADVVLITVDALRADRVGAYGYQRPTTPNIDRLAARGVRFERAYAQAPHTSFSITSLLTGKYYPTQARMGPSDGLDTLPLYLRRYGWKTAAFYPEAVFFVDADKIKAYQQGKFQFEYIREETLDAHAQISEIAKFFTVEKPARAFLWVHFFDPHEPYDKHPAHDFGNADRDRYDSEVAYTDAAIGRLLTYLEKHRPGAIVILTADHGEEFDEHGGRYHGTTLYDEQIRVPLIIAVPGVPSQVVQGPAELVDVAPTVLGLLDIPPPVRMRGTDLGPWLASPPAPAERLGFAFAEVDEQRMIASARDKLICHVQKGFCSYHDLRADPGERRDDAESRPDRVAALRAELDDWLSSHARFGSEAAGGATVSVPVVLERARLGDVAVRGQMGQLLAADQPLAVRREAARLLATELPPDRQSGPTLLALRSDPDAEVRGWALVAEGRLQEASALPGLLALVTASRPGGAGQPEPLVVQAALVLVDWIRARRPQPLPMGSKADAAAAAVLIDTLADCGDVGQCRRVIEALGALGDRRATASLIARLDNVMTRREVVDALGELADPAAVAALVSRLKHDEYVPVRSAAAAALGVMGGAQARAALTDARKTEREAVVRAAIDKALASH